MGPLKIAGTLLARNELVTRFVESRKAIAGRRSVSKGYVE